MRSEKDDIHLFNQSTAELPISEKHIRNIVQKLSQREGCSFRLLEIVFVDEEEIVRINKEYLNHNYITDIITFRYDENEQYENIEGTLYCCASRIKGQAHEFDTSESSEFNRVVIHGLLHLIGYEDQSEKTQQQMTEKEDLYLSLTT